MFRIIVAALGLSIFIAGCKSGEEKFCERASAEKILDPASPNPKEKCKEGYRKLDPTQRACVDACVKKPNLDLCTMTCGAADAPTHNTPPPTPSASSSVR
jgi:hypothetical protein